MTLVAVWVCTTDGCRVRLFAPGPSCPWCHRRGRLAQRRRLGERRPT